jgi:hypothetical protein
LDGRAPKCEKKKSTISYGRAKKGYDANIYGSISMEEPKKGGPKCEPPDINNV